MGLDQLAKEKVETVFSTILSKFNSVDDFLSHFGDVLCTLYEHKGYQGGELCNQEKMDSLLRDYVLKTDAIKKDYRDKKIVHLTGSSVTVVGGILSYTPLAPIGWGLLAAGSSMNAITDVVDLADKNKQKAWENAKNSLKDYVERPYANSSFWDVYDSIIKSYKNVSDKIAIDDFSILLQGMGWNYFLFRTTEGCDHDTALNKLHEVLELFQTNKYIISTDLKQGKQDAINDIRNQIEASSMNLTTTVAALGLVGLSAGIGIGSIVAGCNIALSTLKFSESMAHILLTIGNSALRFVNIMQKIGPSLAIVGGVISIVFDSCAIKNLDKSFKPYYDFGDNCKSIFEKYKKEYDQTEVAICEMFKFIEEDRTEKNE